MVGKMFVLVLFTLFSILDEYKSEGNSFFAKGGRNNKRAQVKHTLRLFRSLVSIKDERVYLDLCDQGIIPSFTG